MTIGEAKPGKAGKGSILFVLCKVVLAPKRVVVASNEPELHLESVHLCNELKQMQPNMLFIYIQHSEDC